MKKTQVKIDALSVAKNNTGSYLIILADSNRKLPIIINPIDAQFISLKINNINTRPFTPDIFGTITDIYDVSIHEVYIYAFDNGTFYARVITSNGSDVYEIDCTVSTAVTMSVVYNCPIFVSEEVMDSESIETEEDGKGNIVPLRKEGIKKLSYTPKLKMAKETYEVLNKQLKEALEKEEYELAVVIRDKITKKKSKRKTK